MSGGTTIPPVDHAGKPAVRALRRGQFQAGRIVLALGDNEYDLAAIGQSSVQRRLPGIPAQVNMYTAALADRVKALPGLRLDQGY